MREYELALVVKPDLEKSAYDEIREKISVVLEKEKGSIKTWNVWKERYKLSYTLRSRGAEKHKYNEATYLLCEFLFNPQAQASLKYVLDLEERIIRYLIINKELR
jgi:ribosomal protein S6